MPDRTITIAEPTAADVRIALRRDNGVPMATVLYERSGVHHAAEVDCSAAAGELTAAERAALQTAVQAILNRAKARMGF